MGKDLVKFSIVVKNNSKNRFMKKEFCMTSSLMFSMNLADRSFNDLEKTFDIFAGKPNCVSFMKTDDCYFLEMKYGKDFVINVNIYIDIKKSTIMLKEGGRILFKTIFHDRSILSDILTSFDSLISDLYRN